MSKTLEYEHYLRRDILDDLGYKILTDIEDFEEIKWRVYKHFEPFTLQGIIEFMVLIQYIRTDRVEFNTSWEYESLDRSISTMLKELIDNFTIVSKSSQKTITDLTKKDE